MTLLCEVLCTYARNVGKAFVQCTVFVRAYTSNEQSDLYMIVNAKVLLVATTSLSKHKHLD